MQFQKKEKRQTTVRFDSHHVRLRTGEVQRKTGSYMYRWTDKLGKRNTIYAATLEDLREQEEQILVDQHDGIKANIKNVTVNDVYELWCQLKRGIKDSTMKNYIYMYELFVKPTFGKKKLVQVKKSDVRRFYKVAFRAGNIFIRTDSEEDVRTARKQFGFWRRKKYMDENSPKP